MVGHATRQPTAVLKAAFPSKKSIATNTLAKLIFQEYTDQKFRLSQQTTWNMYLKKLK